MPHLYFYLIVFIFGLVVGSFLNCLIYRLETGQSFLGSRSFCPHCKHKLSWFDLIPVLSFLFLRGKCRYCRKPISLQYPLVELAAGILFFLIFWVLGFGLHLAFGFWLSNFLFYLVIASFLIIIFIYDLKHYIIPDKIIYPAIAAALFYQLFIILDFRFFLSFGFWHLDFQSLINPFLSAILSSAFFLFIVLVSRGLWMGIGDIKLAFLMGLFLGWPSILVALFSAFSAGAIIGIGLILAGKKTLKSEVPFGPFLVFGTFLALFFGEKLFNWYLNFILV